MSGLRVAFKTASQAFPVQGNRELPLTIDFTNTATVADDLTPEMQASQIEIIQSIYIDNSLNANSFSIQFNNYQIITAQPFTQGVYPVIAWGGVRYVASTSQGIKIPVIFSNTAKNCFVWGPNSVSGGSILRGVFTDRSAALAVGGASQQLMAANAGRLRFVIENPATAAGQGIAGAESVFVNFANAAGINNGTSIEITPGGSFDSGAGPVSTQQINFNATTVGHVLIAKEM